MTRELLLQRLTAPASSSTRTGSASIIGTSPTPSQWRTPSSSSRPLKQAGVGRVVHVSITNPSEDSALPYFKGKARLERALQESSLPHSILRPALLFGREDILINNIAWALRRLPVFGVFGRGDYRIQPIYVEDFAALAVSESRQTDNRVVDAIGPETFTFRRLVEEIRSHHRQTQTNPVGPSCLPNFVASIIGRVVNDVFLTREEIDGLMANLLSPLPNPQGKPS